MSLETLITELNTVLGAMTGIERWYADPPESMSEFPSGITYAATGELHAVSGGLGKCLHDIAFEIHHSRTVLPESIDAAKVWPDRVLLALAANPLINGASDGIVWPIRYQASPLEYAKEIHYGVRFRVVVKQMVAIP